MQLWRRKKKREDKTKKWHPDKKREPEDIDGIPFSRFCPGCNSNSTLNANMLSFNHCSLSSHSKLLIYIQEFLDRYKGLIF
ncbi:hypothetical protein OPV22_026155 [Ensete ventricosum]|uniref:Uncharacterized protein n=1 Tax=Ensete ventricosum TaxID=4639 RepID=A0AAV8QJA7_ENSVE|nr:hypothetical protein OPV22_026155 [Ensete ventricosum]